MAPENIHTLPQRMFIGDSKEESQNAKTFKGKNKPKPEFPRGGGREVKHKDSPDILWKTRSGKDRNNTKGNNPTPLTSQHQLMLFLLFI